MKKIIAIIFLIAITITFKGQENQNMYGEGGCYVNGTLDPLPKGTNDFTPSGNIKNIRLIFHFILKDDGTGNFNETNDGLTPENDFDLSGYEYTEYIVRLMNNHLSNTCEMNLEPFGDIDVYDPEYRFKSVGTFFWRNSENFMATFSSTLHNIYSKNTNDCMNIFLVNKENSADSTVGGSAPLGGSHVWSAKHYFQYKKALDSSNMWYNDFTQKLLNHELGHTFNLSHTMLTGGGTCSMTVNDYCDDTPTIVDMLNIGEPDPCCWNQPHCSNNLMDYNADNCALTPDQLTRVHYELDNDKYLMWSKHFEDAVLNVCDINESDSYIAESVTFAESCSSSIIDNGKSVFVNASEVIFYPGFEVKTGSRLFVKTNESE